MRYHLQLEYEKDEIVCGPNSIPFERTAFGLYVPYVASPLPQP
jgi:hypothetical protein